PVLYTLSLHDALPIFDLDAHVERHLDAQQGQDDETVEGGVPRVEAENGLRRDVVGGRVSAEQPGEARQADRQDRGAIDDKDAVEDRKSTRLNSSHVAI